MAEIINLRRERKARKRLEASHKAEQNRVSHGLTKTEREKAKQVQLEEGRDLDGKHLGSGPRD